MHSAADGPATWLAQQVYDLSRAAGGQGGAGGGGFSSSGRAVKPGPRSGAAKRPVVTGFEGLQPTFFGEGVYPAYRPGTVQTIHSGGWVGLQGGGQVGGTAA